MHMQLGAETYFQSSLSTSKIKQALLSYLAPNMDVCVLVTSVSQEFTLRNPPTVQTPIPHFPFSVGPADENKLSREELKTGRWEGLGIYWEGVMSAAKPARGASGPALQQEEHRKPPTWTELIVCQVQRVQLSIGFSKTIDLEAGVKN